MRLPLVRRIVALAISSLLLQSCAFFSGKPPLPKHAAIERAPNPAPTANFAALLEGADIIYFPDERVGFGGRSEPAALLMDALEKSGRSFAIGWDLIDARQQPLLDSLPAQDATAREQVITLLQLAGSGRAREYCRSVLREANSSKGTQMALRYQADASALGLHRHEFAAEKIARYLRAAGSEARALIFLREEDLDEEEGVPNYVAQKMRARQLILGSERAQKERPRLLTRS